MEEWLADSVDTFFWSNLHGWESYGPFYTWLGASTVASHPQLGTINTNFHLWHSVT